MSGLCDSTQRPINYLRIAVTDRCNLRCIYCMPPSGVKLMHHADVLRYEEIVRVAQAAAELGISKLRLTGGEPLVREELPVLVRMLASLDGIDDLSMTTNGVLLKRYANILKSSGLKRVNISLDTLNRERYQHITGHDSLGDVLAGMTAAISAGLDPVKLNVVVMRGVNDDEILDFAKMTISDGWHVRFIEKMPFSDIPEIDSVATGEIQEQLEAIGKLEACLPRTGNGPAKYFRYEGATGTIGFISPVSEHICFSCNRLRLTVDGKLRPCLLNDYEIDIKSILRAGATLEDIKELIQQAVAAKPKGHRLDDGISPKGRSMSQVGG